MYFTSTLLLATVFAVLGYLTLYCSIRSEGGVRTLGRVLAVWVFVVALIFVLTGAYFTIMGYTPLETHFKEMHGRE